MQRGPTLSFFVITASHFSIHSSKFLIQISACIRILMKCPLPQNYHASNYTGLRRGPTQLTAIRTQIMGRQQMAVTAILAAILKVKIVE